MKSQLLIGIAGIALTLLLAGAAHGQASDLVCTQCVNTSDVADNAISNQKLKAGAVTSEKIGNGEVQTADIKAGAVTSEKIGAGEVKTADIEAGAVTSDKIGNGEVQTADIKAGSVTEAKLEPALQAKLAAPQVVMAGGGFFNYATTLEYGAGCTSTGGEVTITVPGPGTIKVDAQADLVLIDHQFDVEDQIILYLEGTSPPMDLGVCEDLNEPGYSPRELRISFQDPTPAHYRLIVLSRIFRVASEGTYTFYLNGYRVRGLSFATVSNITLQALYVPDL